MSSKLMDIIPKLEAESQTMADAEQQQGEQNKPLNDELDTQTPIETKCTLTEQVEAIKAKHTEPITHTEFKYEIHDVAKDLEEYDITDLKNSISENGLFQPVLLWYDKSTGKLFLVDGRHRVKAWYALRSDDIKTTTLPRTTREKDLPRVVLEAQILRRGADKIVANCEITLYIERYGVKQTDMIDMYEIAKKDMLKYLAKIRNVRPVWFSTLRIGGFVKDDADNVITGLRKMYDICKAEEKALTDTEKEPGDESVALAFAKMKPHITALLSVVGKDDKLLYAVNQLIKQGTKDFSDDYCITMPERQIQELEQELQTINENNTSLIKYSENIESELDDFKVMYVEHQLSENVDDTDCNTED